MKWKLILFFAVLLAGFFFTNPSQEAYREFLLGDLKEKAIGGSALDRFLKDNQGTSWLQLGEELAGDATTYYLNKNTTRSNYWFWSVYETNIFGYEFRYVGVATMFIEASDEAVEEQSPQS